jgi:pyrroloquinoline quinone (PQQ) biosynthesis protein C
MAFEERIRNNQKHEDKWTDEVEAHGIDRLKIDET